MTEIVDVKARKILGSGGNATVEVRVVISSDATRCRNACSGCGGEDGRYRRYFLAALKSAWKCLKALLQIRRVLGGFL